jgi:hypothetical protein
MANKDWRVMALLSDFFLAPDFETVRSGRASPVWETANTNGLHIAILGEVVTGQPWDALLCEMAEQPLCKDDAEMIGRVPEIVMTALAALTDSDIPAVVDCLQSMDEWQGGEHPADVLPYLQSLRCLCQRALQQNLTLFLVTRL